MDKLLELQKEANKILKSSDNENSLNAFKNVINFEIKPNDDVNKIKEDAILAICSIYQTQGSVSMIRKLVVELRPFFSTIPQAKTGKIVRTILENAAEIQDSLKEVAELCKEVIEWADSEKRTMLRMFVQTKLAECLFKLNEFTATLDLLKSLSKEVKKLDDKQLLVAIFLLESRTHHALQHLPKSRASLTVGRATANEIYCPPSLQADLDLQAGILHAEERDYKTSYSYFYEAYENYVTLSTKEAKELSLLCLKYMLLTKIIAGTKEDVSILLGGKLAVQYTHEILASMRAIANAYQKSSLRELNEVLLKYKQDLDRDTVINRHLKQLYQKLLEENLLRLVKPYSQVELSHIAELIELDVQIVEKKLSQMVLDKKLMGILDQGNDCLIVFDDPESDSVYPLSLDVIENLGEVVDSLFVRAGRLR
jgi:26S proteasome regulatory subunit N6